MALCMVCCVEYGVDAGRHGYNNFLQQLKLNFPDVTYA